MTIEIGEIRSEARALGVGEVFGAIGCEVHAGDCSAVLFSGMRAIFSHRLEVRFRDCDPMGHVNNAVYLTYLEQARIAQWRALWGFGRVPDAPVGDTDRASQTSSQTAHVAVPSAPGVILARTEIDYRIPARHGDVLDVKIGLAAVGRSSFTYEYQIVDAQARLVASARSVQVMYDYTTSRSVPIPDDIRRLFDAL